MRYFVFLLVSAAALGSGCTAGVAHSVAVILPTPHVGGAGNAKQFGSLFFYTDRNMPDTSLAYNALLAGKVAEALNMLSRIEGANLPAVQRAYWQNDVAVCFILEGRYREADELLLQAGMTAEEEAIRHNHRVSVYLAESQRTAKGKAVPPAVEAGKQEADAKK